MYSINICIGSLLSMVILIFTSDSFHWLCSKLTSSHLRCNTNIDSQQYRSSHPYLIVDQINLLNSSSGESSLLQTRNQTNSPLGISFPRPYYLLRRVIHTTTDRKSKRQRRRKKDPAKISFPFLHLL